MAVKLIRKGDSSLDRRLHRELKSNVRLSHPVGFSSKHQAAHLQGNAAAAILLAPQSCSRSARHAWVHIRALIRDLCSTWRASETFTLPKQSWLSCWTTQTGETCKSMWGKSI